MASFTILPDDRPFSWPRSRGAWLVLALLAALGAGYLGLRAAGIVTLVGYHHGLDRWFGETGARFDALRFGWPVRLRPGEGLRADYAVDAPSGEVRLMARPVAWALRGLPWASEQISGQADGSVIFVAREADVFAFESRLDPFDRTRLCRRLGPDPCGGPDVSWRVTWTAASAAEVERARRDGLRTIDIPLAGEQVRRASAGAAP
jgi:hypothetical protein